MQMVRALLGGGEIRSLFWSGMVAGHSLVLALWSGLIVAVLLTLITIVY